MLGDNLDTIVAIATPVGVAGVGVIRLSGPDSCPFIKSCFSIKRADFVPRHVYTGRLIDPETKGVIDQVCVVYFKAPHSYTGEDVVEVHCHSSPFLLKRILSIFVSLGASLAGKGDFTKRAFIHGKCDLTQSESVIDLIHSQTEQQHVVNLNRVEGKLFHHIEIIRKRLMIFLEEIEGSIDFPDEVPPINHVQMRKQLSGLFQEIDHMLSLQDMGTIISGGVHCVVVGKPNVGKSSLFNVLLSQDRSIVTDIAGTTRDYVKESIEYQGYLFHFYDTAGLHEEGDLVEFMGMEKMKGLIQKATLILWVIDQSSPYSEDDRHVYDAIASHKNVCVVLNKADLPSQLKVSDIPISYKEKTFTCSTKESARILSLKSYLLSLSIQPLSGDDMELLCNVRQRDCLQRVYNAVRDLIEGLSNRIEDDILAVDLREAISVCGEMTGDVLTETLLDGIFSRFCVGK